MSLIDENLQNLQDSLTNIELDSTAFNEDFLSNIWTYLIETISFLWIKLFYIAVVFIIWRFIIKMIWKWVDLFTKRIKWDKTLVRFITSLLSFALNWLLIILIGFIIGIKASALIAFVWAIILAIWLSIQWSLSNFAGWVLILIFKHYKVWDDIVYDGYFGTVIDISILYTRLRTYDGIIITIANWEIANSKVENYSWEKHRRIEMPLFFSLDEDFDNIRRVIVDTMQAHPYTIDSMEYQVWHQWYKDSMMEVSARCWTLNMDFWAVQWDLRESIKKTLDKEWISLAIPSYRVYEWVKNTLNSDTVKPKENIKTP